MHHALFTDQYITHMIMHSSFIILLTLTNLARFIFEPPANAVSSEFAERPYQVNFLIDETVLRGKGYYVLRCVANKGIVPNISKVKL